MRPEGSMPPATQGRRSEVGRPALPVLARSTGRPATQGRRPEVGRPALPVFGGVDGLIRDSPSPRMGARRTTNTSGPVPRLGVVWQATTPAPSGRQL